MILYGDLAKIISTGSLKGIAKRYFDLSCQQTANEEIRKKWSLHLRGKLATSNDFKIQDLVLQLVYGEM